MLTREWFSAADLAALQLRSMPGTERGVQLVAADQQWQRAEWEGLRWRQRAGRGGGIEYHYTVLGAVALTDLTLKVHRADGQAEAARGKAALSRADMWAWYEGLSEKKRATALRRLEVLERIRALTIAGTGKVMAMDLVAAEQRVNRDTIYAWERLVDGIERHDWLPYLAPRHAGACVQQVDCPDEAWDILRSDYLRPESPTFESCYRRLQRIAAERGWALPSARTLQRRIEALPLATRVLARKGEDGLKAMLPAQRRDHAVFHALEAVNTDGHIWDVAVRWEDGTVSRPVMVGFQDIYSGMMLSWRLDRTENADLVRLAFGDVVERYGIPEHVWADNGRAFMSRVISGGMTRRFRFKMLPSEPLGIMTTLGVQLHSTKPYSGRSKPIERAWRDFCDTIAKHPVCAGAYLGNSPVNKPSNYGSATVPIDTFRQLLAQEIEEHNTRLGRTGGVCNGRSFRQVFEESYAANSARIRIATEQQRRICLLAAQGVKVRADSTVHLLGNRYSAEWLTEHVGRSLVLRFDPDNLHGAVHLYRLDGAFLGTAPCIEDVGFNSTNAARADATARKERLKAEKARLAAERRLDNQALARITMRTKEPEPYAPPAPRVVRGNFGAALAIAPATLPADEDEDEYDRLMRVGREKQQAAGNSLLRVVTNQDAD